jgi:hypothetical protein
MSSPLHTFVGEDWNGGDIESWPGISGNASSHGNYYKFKGGVVEPHPESSTNNHIGGRSHRRSNRRIKHRRSRSHKRSRTHRNKRSRRHHKQTRCMKKDKNSRHTSRHTKRRRHTHHKQYKQKGGGFITQPFVNLGRNIVFGAEELISGWNGKQPPLSPSPTIQPIEQSQTQLSSGLPSIPDIDKIRASADNQVAQL